MTDALSRKRPQAATPLPAGSWPISAGIDYAMDSTQRAVLFWDMLRRRGNQYLEHLQEKIPHVLQFHGEILIDGRRLPRPVNYGLVRIVPPDGVTIDPLKRPFVIIDPRAGHGPGIGGFKPDSEIGAALRAGHACYFIGFLPEPVAGQTIEDVCEAEAAFIEAVIARHPQAEGKPAVIGNCQAGWSVMMVAALRPDLFGPIILAGAPLSYWQGVHGANPMRYAGGLLGGNWLSLLAGDLGGGIFDGAWLVQNFENLNPANTLWGKQYDLYAKVDTEGPRYLGFEKWWGGHILLTAEEIEFITGELFIGNRLSSGGIFTRNGDRIDLRAVSSPILVFCSRGDNITPPQQALGWILDLYSSVEDIRAHGQTIVYAVHDTIGHLGIFVSGSVARKEHTEFASNIDLIDVLPPGLYEVVLEPKDPQDPSAAFAQGDYIARFVPRTLDDIRALGGNDEEDDRRFAAAARVSEINAGLYRLFVRPWARAFSNDAAARAVRRLHPNRLQYELASDANPLMWPLPAAAARVREERRPVPPDNPFLAWQDEASRCIMAGLDAWRDWRDMVAEQTFLAVYGSPVLQAAVGLYGAPPPRRPGSAAIPDDHALVERRIESLLASMTVGGLREAGVRAMLYVGMVDPTADERDFAVLRLIRSERGARLDLAAFKRVVRQQLSLLRLDEERALATLPDLVREEAEHVPALMAALRRLAAARGEPGPERLRRLARIEKILGEAVSRTPPAGAAESSQAGRRTRRRVRKTE